MMSAISPRPVPRAWRSDAASSMSNVLKVNEVA